MSLKITDLRTEFRTAPIGIDVKKPRFSWKLQAGTDNKPGSSILQSSYRITVGSEPGSSDLWDSGVVSGRDSNNVVYAGAELQNKTRYYWQVAVTDNAGEQAQSETAFFETGLGISDGSAFGGEWIGPSEYTLCADVRAIFGIRMGFRLHEGSSRIALVFGEGDKRVKTGRNYFSYEIDASSIPAMLHIYRVGIFPEDSADTPIASVPVTDYDDPEHAPLITEENKYDEHILDVQVTGNNAYALLDGKRVDVTIKRAFFGEAEAPRQINPLSDNDINTWPRLNRIGWHLAAGQGADITLMEIRNLRKPCAVIYEDHETHVLDAGEEIFCTKDPSHTSIPMLRREFDIEEKPVRSARLYATARGIYECRVNGEELTDTWFNPGATQYDRRIMYQTYDITPYLKAGKNAIGVILASGWWSDAQTFALMNFNYFGDRESFLGRIEICYEDGTNKVITTDTRDWKYSGKGPWTYAGFFHGEHYDASVAEKFADFAKPGFDDSDWSAPVTFEPVPIDLEDTPSRPPMIMWPEVNKTSPIFVGQTGEGVRVSYELTALSVSEPEPGVYIYDMGVNVAGVPKVHLCGERGTTAMLRFAELLYPDLPEFSGKAGTMFVENLRDADCTDLYTFAGKAGGEDYNPRFTFRGYRYIEISGVSRKPSLEEVKMLVLSSLDHLTGDLEVSDPMTNQFIGNVRRSQQSNFISIPTDCPQRNERMGWDGDTSIFSRTATFQAEGTHDFYIRWLEAMRDLQEENGKYPDIAPVGGGFGGYTYESAALHAAWEVYQQFGDTRIIEDNYEAMCRFMDYSASNLRNTGKLAAGFTLGDWLAPEETDLTLICDSFYGYNAYVMARMAAAIGKAEDAARFESLYQDLKAAFNPTYFDPETGRTKDHTQCSYALPLSFHMVNEDLVQKVGDQLAAKTAETDYRVNTGFFGTAPMNPMLTATGHAQDAYRLMQQTKCPSWLYPVTQGATSVWERWDSFTIENGFGGHNSMNSFNHYSLGAVLEWFYMYVLGIQRDENAPGYRHFTLQPYFGAYEYAKGGFESPYGRIEASWHKNGNESGNDNEKVNENIGYTYCVRIPENTTATVILPGKEAQEFGSGVYEFTV